MRRKHALELLDEWFSAINVYQINATNSDLKAAIWQPSSDGGTDDLWPVRFEEAVSRRSNTNAWPVGSR